MASALAITAAEKSNRPKIIAAKLKSAEEIKTELKRLRKELAQVLGFPYDPQ